MYVWMDALTNYLTVTGYPWKDMSDSQKAVCGWPADAQVVGKDILRFHAVYWPAFLMAADLAVPKKIVAHAHWTQGKMKMSKSIGNVVDPFTAMQEFGTDTIRFYLMNDGGLVDDAGKKINLANLFVVLICCIDNELVFSPQWLFSPLIRLLIGAGCRKIQEVACRTAWKPFEQIDLGGFEPIQQGAKTTLSRQYSP